MFTSFSSEVITGAGSVRRISRGGEKNSFTPSPESLKVEDSPNPLIKPKRTSVQGELF